MQLLNRAILIAATAVVLAVAFCAILLIHQHKAETAKAPAKPAYGCFVVIGGMPSPCDMLSTRLPPPSGPATGSSGPHGCAVFGASVPSCESYPNWSSGYWKPPAGVQNAQVVLVGGGGGGGASTSQRGGGGGGSGQVIAGTTRLGGDVYIAVGAGGTGALGTFENSERGSPSYYNQSMALGGIGGQPDGSGGFGNSGGGGGGGDSNSPGYWPGDGGAGGEGGGGGMAGSNGGNPKHPMLGGNGGNGLSYPTFNFTRNDVGPGPGGVGGAGTGMSGSGCGGGGGGGGGGILLGDSGPLAESGVDSGVPNPRCWDNEGFAGQGGTGFGAGGGGGGDVSATSGGAGEPGVVYIEW